MTCLEVSRPAFPHLGNISRTELSTERARGAGLGSLAGVACPLSISFHVGLMVGLWRAIPVVTDPARTAALFPLQVAIERHIPWCSLRGLRLEKSCHFKVNRFIE